MYQVNDLVLYSVHGVCKVVELQVQIVNRKRVEYLVLEPLSQATSRFFVPAENKTALAKLRPLLSKQEIMELLGSPASHQNLWIDDENQRKQQYKDLLASCDRGMLLSLLRLLELHKQNQTEMGKKFHISDANFMRDAQKIIFSEFSFVLEIPNETVAQYILTL